MVMMIDSEKLCADCVRWISNWFAANGPSCNAVVGMSGGKDSTVVAALCAKALGSDRVIGVALPSNGQGVNDADKICDFLGIEYLCVNIGETENSFRAIEKAGVAMSTQARMNIPPRIRMTMLYAIAQCRNGMVANTCNLSEDYIGYSTLYGDAAGSFAPIARLCAREVRALGHELVLPSEWVEKVPDDGLPGSCPDEEKFGFSYDTLDRYIREGVCEDVEIREKIDRMHRSNTFKTDILRIPAYEPHL